MGSVGASILFIYTSKRNMWRFFQWERKDHLSQAHSKSPPIGVVADMSGYLGISSRLSVQGFARSAKVRIGTGHINSGSLAGTRCTAPTTLLTELMRRPRVNIGAANSGQPWEIAEAALAHTVQGVEGAYFRSDLFEQRRRVMDAWGDYIH